MLRRILSLRLASAAGALAAAADLFSGASLLFFRRVGEAPSVLRLTLQLSEEPALLTAAAKRQLRGRVTNSNDFRFSANQELFTKTKRCVSLKLPQPLCLISAAGALAAAADDL